MPIGMGAFVSERIGSIEVVYDGSMDDEGV